MIRKCLLGITMIMTSLCLSLPICSAASVSAAVVDTSEEVAPCNEGYIWYYKEVDGVKYMRLWDMLNRRWVTDWFPVEE